ncbi:MULTISPECIES: hypothetical protein [unclassified Micromonospora]|uniref:hypothetical protein n=1 Tax=unclassified Micromonospora TaxID=2617518 RepID=UPI001C21BFC7|nr:MULTISPECIES: hypothetical protein [unclassified Micromonospora]MBU8861502.1 hypothetical protein [Micromonospora sp. WMMB482]MDM4781069.1 hypothetical protein [Micromonospora sp. b486]
MVRTARGVLSRATDSPGPERLTRAGFVGYGILRLRFAWVVARVASGGPNADGDQSGAMQGSPTSRSGWR